MTDRHRCTAWLGAVLFALAACLLPRHAAATCGTPQGGSPTVTFSAPTTITVPQNASPGTVLYTSSIAYPAPTTTVVCRNRVDFGITNYRGTTPGSGTVFPTGVAGIGYKIAHDSVTNFLLPYPLDSENDGTSTTYTLSIGSYLQLVVTGAVSGGVLAAGSLGYWHYDNNANLQTFTLANNVVFTTPCSVVTNPVNVTLPTVSSKAFDGVGSTTGTTSFTIDLNCSGGATLSITLDSNGKVAGKTGVISSTGSAGGVGVQLLDGKGNPVAFGTSTSLGQAPVGTLNVPYFARYYQTAGTVTGGNVTATANFTLTYQ